MTRYATSRDGIAITPKNDYEFPFRFFFQLPEPRRGRQIVERDEKGRIIRPEVAAMPLYAQKELISRGYVPTG